MRALLALVAVVCVLLWVFSEWRFDERHGPCRDTVEVWTLDEGVFNACVREVSVGEYQEFVDWIARTGDHSLCDVREGVNRSHEPRHVRKEFIRHRESPVVGLDWFDAQAYASWRGMRLPTRAQWIRLAQASGLAAGNLCIGGEAAMDLRGLGLPTASGWTVARLRSSDVALRASLWGGVSEWCCDKQEEGMMVPVLGGNWYLKNTAPTVTVWRNRNYRHSTVGFRCVLPLDERQEESEVVGIALQRRVGQGR